MKREAVAPSLLKGTSFLYNLRVSIVLEGKPNCTAASRPEVVGVEILMLSLPSVFERMTTKVPPPAVVDSNPNVVLALMLALTSMAVAPPGERKSVFANTCW